MSNPSANPIEFPTLEPTPSRVTKFREDRRLSVISGIRAAALAGILMTVVFCIFNYQEDLNLDNIRRIFSYLEQMSLRESESETFTFEAGISTDCIAYDIGLATCSGGSFRFIPPFENTGFAHQIGYSRPTMRVSGNSVLVYDLGGKGISRLNSYSLLAETHLNSPLLSLSANNSGECAVVTDEESYRTALTVFDKRLNEVFKWQTSDHFAFLCALSPDSRTAAVLCVGQEGGRASFYIRYQPLNGDPSEITVRLGDKRVYSMEYADNDTLTVLCEDGLYAFNEKGEQTAAYSFAGGSLIAFEHRPEGYCALSLQGDRGDTSRILLLDSGCNVLFESTCSGHVRDLTHVRDQLAWVSGKTLYKADLSAPAEENHIESVELSGLRGVLITGNDQIAAIFGDSARIISFEPETTETPTEGANP